MIEYYYAQIKQGNLMLSLVINTSNHLSIKLLFVNWGINWLSSDGERASLPNRDNCL